MNKKGILPALFIMIMAGVILVGFIAFIFSSTFKFTVVGGALVIMAFVLLLSKGVFTRKQDGVKIALFLVLLVVGLGLLLGGGLLQSITGGERYVEVPFFATIACERGITSSFPSEIPTNGDWFFKGSGLPENADSWNIKIRTPNEGLFSSGLRVDNNICTCG